MKKSKILSSALVMGMVSFGAYAADELIKGGAGTCTVDVLGVSDNNDTANTIAVWSINEYTLNPGEYLSVTETSVDKTQCPAGSYCVGGSGFTVDNAKTSIEQCPTEYPNSAAGAGAQTQCYTACTVATANIAHATAVGGNDYFGTGTDACYATDCDTGYHVDGDIELIEQTPVIPVNYETAGTGNYASMNLNGRTWYNGISNDLLTANGTWVNEFDYGRVYGRASCQPSVADPALEYFFNNAKSVGGDITREEFYAGLVSAGGVAKADILMDYYEGLWGDGYLGDDYESFLKKFYTVFSDKEANYQTTDSGRYCYCQMDGFRPTGGTREIVTSAPWVFRYDDGSAGDCASDCAGNCASALPFDDVFERAFRAAVFGALGYTETATCAANTINIDWNPDNGGDHTKNMCTYDGAITLPTPDPVKPGYTFTGWKLVE